MFSIASPLVELARLFLRLGLTSFGGPAAHTAFVRDEVVGRRRWLTDAEFLDLVAASNLIPGPNSTELAMHISLRRARLAGLVVAGASFIAPAFLLVLAIAVGYAERRDLAARGGLPSGRLHAMPIYEFRCRSCGKKTTALVLVRNRASEVRCRHCQSGDLERLWSRFATVKSDDARVEALADPSSMAGLDENDPKSMMRWMKRMGQEMGEDLGDDFEAAMEEEMTREGSDGGEGDGDDAMAPGAPASSDGDESS